MSELFSITSNAKLIRYIQVTLNALYSQKPKFLYQLDQFIDNSIPRHPLAYFIKLFMFCNVKEEYIQNEIRDILISITHLPFSDIKEFFKIFISAFHHFGDKFLFKFNEGNILLIYKLFDENDSLAYSDLLEKMFFCIIQNDPNSDLIQDIHS